uniref:Nuclease HARBI1 n=1 Tax=Cacopsylla melanoneura TaxID=428564 RepID=A0A8D9AYH6_9HEMI
MDEFDQFLAHYRENEYDLVRAPKRYLRDPGNLLEYFDDDQFFRRYRFSKDVVVNVIFPLVRNILETDTMQGVIQPPMTRLLAVMQFYASGNFQICVGDAHGLSQPTMCQLVTKVSKELAESHRNYIKFPDQLAATKAAFQGIGNFPGVVGCVDCTHVPIQLPFVENGENFRNRKGFFLGKCSSHWRT